MNCPIILMLQYVAFIWVHIYKKHDMYVICRWAFVHMHWFFWPAHAGQLRIAVGNIMDPYGDGTGLDSTRGTSSTGGFSPSLIFVESSLPGNEILPGLETTKEQMRWKVILMEEELCLHVSSEWLIMINSGWWCCWWWWLWTMLDGD